MLALRMDCSRLRARFKIILSRCLVFLVAFVQRDDPGASKHLARTHVSLNRTTSIVIVFETAKNGIEKELSKSDSIGSDDVGSEGL